MAQYELPELYADAFRGLARNRPIPEIEVKFYAYAGLHHTIRLRAGRVYVRISDVFACAPLSVHRALAFILVAKLLSRKPQEAHQRIYREYAYSPEIMRASDITRRARGRKRISSPSGNFYNLDRIFDRLNRRYFDGSIQKPTLTWSQRRTRSILGHHDGVHDTITISKTLDARDVPEWFVEYIVYHEMLHIKHVARVIKGRRYYHTNAFRAEERRFPHYQQAQEWLERLALRRRLPRTRAA
jgi:hypothetical protein